MEEPHTLRVVPLQLTRRDCSQSSEHSATAPATALATAPDAGQSWEPGNRVNLQTEVLSNGAVGAQAEGGEGEPGLGEGMGSPGWGRGGLQGSQYCSVS